MPAGAASPEELEGMLEDACLLNDTSFLHNLFDVDAVLLTRGTSQVRGQPAIANVIIDRLRHGGSYSSSNRAVWDTSSGRSEMPSSASRRLHSIIISPR